MMVRMDLSKRLHKATGWTTRRWWHRWPLDDPESTTYVVQPSGGDFPAYTLDDLLIKLGSPLILMHHIDGWKASQNGLSGSAETIQDALAVLAIKIHGGTDVEEV